MKYTITEFASKFRSLAGDTTANTPDEFIINGVNWCLTELPMVPKLGKIFSKHYHFNLDAKDHYKWSLNADFRRISDIPMINFYTTTGGDPCKTVLCHKDPEAFYDKNGIIGLKKSGKPCEYTIEVEGDDVNLVLDRPLNVPMIVDYIAYGFPKPVEKMSDEIEISAIAERLMLSILRSVFYQEADDFAFSGAIFDYMDNKYYPEAIQMLNKQFGSDGPIILGEN